VNCYQELQATVQEFDIAVASAVIEHIPSPRSILIALLNSLRVASTSELPPFLR
jgi:2-polyprenyl-3-methyl-5-hydroxy-6-metoxy-1,4-benzoquinol methylase